MADFEWLTPRMARGFLAVLRELEPAEDRVPDGQVIAVVVKTGLATTTAQQLVLRLRDFGAVRKPGWFSRRSGHSRMGLTPLGRRWLDSPEGREVVDRCLRLAACATLDTDGSSDDADRAGDASAHG